MVARKEFLNEAYQELHIILLTDHPVITNLQQNHFNIGQCRCHFLSVLERDNEPVQSLCLTLPFLPPLSV